MPKELAFHPIANIFPLIEDDELDALIQSIRKRGVREPITLYEGEILDGRRRYRAARAPNIAVQDIP
jgi:ParB-like chromosome segregation protein Spo0J